MILGDGEVGRESVRGDIERLEDGRRGKDRGRRRTRRLLSRISYSTSMSTLLYLPGVGKGATFS